jgi:hypothetical protein
MSFTLDLRPDFAAGAGIDGLAAGVALADCAWAGALLVGFSDFSVSTLACGAAAAWGASCSSARGAPDAAPADWASALTAEFVFGLSASTPAVAAPLGISCLVSLDGADAAELAAAGDEALAGLSDFAAGAAADAFAVEVAGLAISEGGGGGAASGGGAAEAGADGGAPTLDGAGFEPPFCAFSGCVDVAGAARAGCRPVSAALGFGFALAGSSGAPAPAV